jgi:RNase H-fold protein (predicted Holliday junction resolvase)
MIAGFDRKTRNNIDDAVAAKLILESALLKIKNSRT